MSNKKAVELSMNMIIVAALGLLVLIIVAIFVINSFSNANKTTSCDAQGGKCAPICPYTDTSTGKDITYPIPATWSCPPNTGICCTKLGGN